MEKRSSTSSSILSRKSTPLQALEKRLTSWDLNMPDDGWASIYSTDKDSLQKDNVSILTDEVPLHRDTESVYALPEAEKEKENSPYEEVRAAVPNYDEDLPANTIRAWVLGLLLSVFGAAVNTIFSLRNPVIGVGVIVAQVCSLP